MLTGFMIAWFAGPDQGEGCTFAPINALVGGDDPLCDCVSLMIRRRVGRKMTAPDPEHLHHYFEARICTCKRSGPLPAERGVRGGGHRGQTQLRVPEPADVLRCSSRFSWATGS